MTHGDHAGGTNARDTSASQQHRKILSPCGYSTSDKEEKQRLLSEEVFGVNVAETKVRKRQNLRSPMAAKDVGNTRINGQEYSRCEHIRCPDPRLLVQAVEGRGNLGLRGRHHSVIQSLMQGV